MRKNNASFKGKQIDNVSKSKPPPDFSCWCKNLKSKENHTATKNPFMYSLFETNIPRKGTARPQVPIFTFMCL